MRVSSPTSLRGCSQLCWPSSRTAGTSAAGPPRKEKRSVSGLRLPTRRGRRSPAWRFRWALPACLCCGLQYLSPSQFFCGALTKSHLEREFYSWVHLAINELIREHPANVKPLFFLCLLKSQSKAFDRNGNGALEVSDLAGLLGVVRGIAGKPSSAGSGKGKPAGAATTGLGLEPAMRAMDQDHSGQVRPLYPHPDPSGRRKNQQRDKKKQLAHKKAAGCGAHGVVVVVESEHSAMRHIKSSTKYYSPEGGGNYM